MLYKGFYIYKIYFFKYIYNLWTLKKINFIKCILTMEEERERGLTSQKFIT